MLSKSCTFTTEPKIGSETISCLDTKSPGNLYEGRTGLIRVCGFDYPVSMAAATERITKTPGICGGRACIAGHRVRVLDVAIWHEQNGWSPDEIVSHVPSITLADVHAALSYYYDRREEIQEEIRAERALAEEFRRLQPSRRN
jgi:uncharacterized protein (DUF433 family)